MSRSSVSRPYRSNAHLVSASILSLLVGGAVYYTIEILSRGWSHWTMALCGGLCLASIYHANRLLYRRSLLLRALCGAAIITLVELIAGCILNLWLGLRIWSYANHTLNIGGQVCVYMSFLWFLLSIPACLLCALIEAFVSRAGLFFKSLGRSMRRHAVYKPNENVRSQ